MVIKIVTHQDEIRAQMFIESNYTRDLLQLNAEELKNKLMQQGIKLSEIDFYEMNQSMMTSDFSNANSNSDSYYQKRRTVHFSKKQDELRLSRLISNIYDFNNSSINYVI